MNSERVTRQGQGDDTRQAAGLTANQSFKIGYRKRAGVTMIELLCVMVIITILASLLLPTVFRAYARVRGMVEEWEGEDIAQMLRHATRNYCSSNPNFLFASKVDFEKKCIFNPKCKDWIEKPSTEFVPFGYLDPTNLVVLSVHIGRRQATLYSFTKEDLSVRPQR